LNQPPGSLHVAPMKKRTEITIELDEIVLVNRGTAWPDLAWCVGCANEVVMVRPEQASVIVEVSVRTINRWVEEGKIHFVETPGSLLVCLNSLTEGEACSYDQQSR
jgi:hypothetical protein